MYYDIFISHASEDKETIVEPLIQILNEKNLKVWYDAESIKLGDNIYSSIMQGISRSRFAIIIFTENFIKKGWTNFELGAFSLQQFANKRKIIPVFFKIDTQYLTSSYQFLTGLKGIHSNSIEEVAEEVFTLFKKYKIHANEYIDLNIKTLIEVCDFFEDCKRHELFSLSSHIRSFIQISYVDFDMAIIKAKKITDWILYDVTEKNNRDNPKTEFNNDLQSFKNTGFINKNILQHIDVINSFYECLLGKDNMNLTSSANNLELCSLSIHAILNWYYNNFFLNKEKNEINLSIVSPSDITDADIIECYNIERLLLPHELISPVEVVLEWYRYNNYIMHGVRDIETKKLIAFINAIPITDSLFAEIEKGNYVDTHIPISEIREYNIPDFYKLYLCSFCVHPEYHNSNAFKLLYDSFIDLLLELASKKDIYISDLIADAVTPDGEKLCKIVDMKHICNSSHKSNIYKTTLIPPSIRLRNIKGAKFLAFYNKKYEEYKELL